MKFFRNNLEFGPFVLKELKAGTYDGKFIPVLDVTFCKVKDGRRRWLSAYVFGKGLQVVYDVSCKCIRCRLNRLRTLVFLRPYGEKEFEAAKKKWEKLWKR
jgi:hypothetical protein